MTDPAERKVRCRYLRRNGNRCENEIAGQGDDDILLCVKHLHRAHVLFKELARLGPKATL
jgi:hypothetical protein